MTNGNGFFHFSVSPKAVVAAILTAVGAVVFIVFTWFKTSEATSVNPKSTAPASLLLIESEIGRLKSDVSSNVRRLEDVQDKYNTKESHTKDVEHLRDTLLRIESGMKEGFASTQSKLTAQEHKIDTMQRQITDIATKVE